MDVGEVFVLRLFNDAVAQFFCYSSLLLFLRGSLVQEHWFAF